MQSICNSEIHILTEEELKMVLGFMKSLLDWKNRISNGDAEALTKFCGLIGIPIIVLLPPLHVVIGRPNERGDEYADVVCPNIAEIYKRYQEWAEEHDNAIVLEDNNPATAMVEVLKCML